MYRPHWTLLLIVAVAAAAGCSHSDLQGDANSMERQMADVVIETDGLVGGMIDVELGRDDGTRSPGEPHTIEISFEGTRACPLGGEVAIAGNMLRTFDPATLTAEATFSGDKTLTDCAYLKEEHVITVNGGAQWDAFRRRVAFRPDGLQTTSYSGSVVAVRDDGEQRSCDFSFEAVWDPATHTRTVTATICGNEFSSSVTWSPGDAG